MPKKFLHYIGGHYTPQVFVKEARKFGWSRRVAPNTVTGMSFSDDVIFLDWRQGNPAAFAQGKITGLIFDGALTAKIAARLKERGHRSEKRGDETQKPLSLPSGTEANHVD